MAKLDEDYEWVEVESFRPASTSGMRGKVHIRPLPGQRFATNLHVECSKRLSTEYPVGTQFRILAKLTDREGAGEFLYSSWRWKFDVIARPDQPM